MVFWLTRLVAESIFLKNVEGFLVIKRASGLFHLSGIGSLFFFFWCWWQQWPAAKYDVHINHTCFSWYREQQQGRHHKSGFHLAGTVRNGLRLHFQWVHFSIFRSVQICNEQ